ncbi:uncharacterized protein PFL1_01113 [Pseudozyma flocculosa PF-1]|uniref:Uncharacterized protein n=1 Tax=Pseudozyma flocculosa TaxID=84751 RepID=A0A5C3FEN0_9BASI|nr:uncharacterized protein PFL1_01113 [Pseudozyma flocculosa PF-1]EPQ31781.1 hypothetical protein PFL1_01113 [Pseudozyma flocculosa PF-1]SPO41829.1 uncharacterized protein PSFLO_07311 [Pseudozyma flocculosa]
MSGGTQSPPLQGKANDPMGQAAPGKDAQSAIPDSEQRGEIFGKGESKDPQGGQAGGAKLDEAIDSAKHASKAVPEK